MITRAWQMTELREVGDDEKGRVISGRAIPYNTPTDIFEFGKVFTERVQHGAFAESVKLRSDRTPLLGFHDARALPLGRTLSLTERENEKPPGLFFEARISDTQAGNESLTLLRDGAIDGVSVGMSIPNGGDVWSDDGTERSITRAYLHEMSLVNFPAYDKARVEAIREATEPHAFADVIEVTGSEIEVPDPLVRVRLEALRFRFHAKRIA